MLKAGKCHVDMQAADYFVIKLANYFRISRLTYLLCRYSLECYYYFVFATAMVAEITNVMYGNFLLGEGSIVRTVLRFAVPVKNIRNDSATYLVILHLPTATTYNPFWTYNECRAQGPDGAVLYT
jgi:hypothetical protein